MGLPELPTESSVLLIQLLQVTSKKFHSADINVVKSDDNKYKSSLVAFATLGAESGDEERLRTLLDWSDAEFYPFDRTAKIRCFCELLGRFRRNSRALGIMEGTGVAGGAALILAHFVFGLKYVVSTGDAVGPFVKKRFVVAGPIASLYEKVLYRFSAGVIGWTPYLVGRALTYGAPRATSAPGWAPFAIKRENLVAVRRASRAKLGIPEHSIVFGIAGALVWNARLKYCYGKELVQAFGSVPRKDIRALIVGDGSGVRFLQELVRRNREDRIIFTGRVRREEICEYIAAMDVGSLPQSVDGVGSFRYTTKLSEYVACGIPIVTGQIPLAYDYDDGWVWRLPGPNPWSTRYVHALAELLSGIDSPTVEEKRRLVPIDSPEFDKGRQVERIRKFLEDLLETEDPT